jgi:hypothetical membrane protein
MKAAGLSGVVAPIISISLISLAIHSAPWFRWTGNALSDLGVEGFPAIIFNTALIIGGMLTAVFAIGLMKALRGHILSRVGSILFLLDAFALCAVGVFPETVGRLHFYVSVAFFALFPLSLIFTGSIMLRKPTQRGWGILAISIAIIAVGVWMFNWSSAAIPEIVASLAASSWSIFSGIKLYKMSQTARKLT